jgi:hypothetical protein
VALLVLVSVVEMLLRHDPAARRQVNAIASAIVPLAYLAVIVSIILW